MRLLIGFNIVALIYVGIQLFTEPVVTPTKIKTDNPSTMRIAIIDTGYDRFDFDYTGPELKLCNQGHHDYTTGLDEIGVSDSHGTAIGQIIATELKGVDYCAVILNVGIDKDRSIDSQNILKALVRAKKQELFAVNLSLGGKRFFQPEYIAMRALTSKTKVFLAAGNLSTNLSKTCNYYPACYTLPTTVVGALAVDLKTRANYTNYNGPVTTWANGEYKCHDKTLTGTSIATPRALSEYVLRYVQLKRTAMNQQKQSE